MSARQMHRYIIPADGKTHIRPMTHDPAAVAAKPLGSDSWAVEFWAEYTDTAPALKRTFQVFRGAQPLPDGARWVGTCAPTCGVTWHLYEIGAGVP